MNPASTTTSASTTSNAFALNHPSMADQHPPFHQHQQQQQQQQQMAANYHNQQPAMQPLPHPPSQPKSLAFPASYTHSTTLPSFEDDDDDDDDDDDSSSGGGSDDDSEEDQSPVAVTRSRAKWRRSGPATLASATAASSAAPTPQVLGNNPSFAVFQPVPGAALLGPVHGAPNPDPALIAQANLAAAVALQAASSAASASRPPKAKKRARKQAPRPRLDEETKRKMHIQTEKNRRAFMNTVYDDVDRELPPVSNSNSTKRPPKLNILQRALEYIRDLKAAHSNLAQELTVLRMTVAQYQHQRHHPSQLQLHHTQLHHPLVLSPVATVFPPNAPVGSSIGVGAQMTGPVQLVPPQHHQQQQQQLNAQQQIHQQAPSGFVHTRSPSAASGSGFIHGNHHISILQNPTPGTTPTIQHSQHPHTHSNLPTRANSSTSVSSVGLGNAHMATSPASNSASSSLNLITSPVDHANSSASHQFSALFPSSSFDDVATIAGGQSNHANHPGFRVVHAPPPSSAAGPTAGIPTATMPTIDTSLLFSGFSLSPPQSAGIVGVGANQVNMTESNVDIPSSATMFSQSNSASPMPPPTPLSPTSATGQSEWSEQQQQPQQLQSQMQRRIVHRPPHLNLHSVPAANAMAGQPMSPFCASPFSPTSPVHAYSPVAAAGAAVGLMSLATAAQGGPQQQQQQEMQQMQQMHVMIQQQQQQQAHEIQAGGNHTPGQQQPQQQGGW